MSMRRADCFVSSDINDAFRDTVLTRAWRNLLRPTNGVRHEHDHDQRRHAYLLQRLGQRTTRRIQPRLAVVGGCFRRSDVLSRFAWLPMRRARSPGAWTLEPAVERQRLGH